MNEEGGGGEAVRSERGNSTSQLCVSLRPLQLFPSVCLLPCCPVTSSYRALCYPRAWPGITCKPQTRTPPSPCSFVMRTRLRDGCLAESPPLLLQRRKKQTPANAISVCLDLSAVTGHLFVSLTAWPLGCWHVDLRPAVPFGHSCRSPSWDEAAVSRPWQPCWPCPFSPGVPGLPAPSLGPGTVPSAARYPGDDVFV